MDGYGLMQDFTAENVWKFWWMTSGKDQNGNGFAREWYLVGTPYCGDLGMYGAGYQNKADRISRIRANKKADTR